MVRMCFYLKKMQSSLGTCLVNMWIGDIFIFSSTNRIVYLILRYTSAFLVSYLTFRYKHLNRTLNRWASWLWNQHFQGVKMNKDSCYTIIIIRGTLIIKAKKCTGSKTQCTSHNLLTFNYFYYFKFALIKSCVIFGFHLLWDASILNLYWCFFFHYHRTPAHMSWVNFMIQKSPTFNP